MSCLVAENWKPNKKNKVILDRAWDMIQGVPYRVTSRWLFYNLLQGGLYQGKDDYGAFLKLTARARHNNYMGWRPDTLADDNRVVVERYWGYLSLDDWIETKTNFGSCNLSPWPSQDQYVEVWFEANAMRSQFEHYTPDFITLRPFGGDPSIDYKWQAAKAIETAHHCYGLPVVILYFGDLDLKGLGIIQTAKDDIRRWCNVDFELVRCGLNPGDEVKYNIPENFEKPGTYQWEALSDAAAKDLITSSLNRYIDYGAMQPIRALEAKTEKYLKEYMRGFRNFIQELDNEL